MGSKGSSPQTTQSQQTYTPNPYVAGAGQQAIQGAGFAAGQPFQQPVAPLAPFDPFQNQAMAGVGQAVGMAQPYFGMGVGYLQGSAAPVTGQDVAGYYNPMAGSVMAGLQDVFGRQMQQTTGQLQQQAGGVGADRVAVGQAELARQQGLAAGQTLAGLYYPALQAAEQQKQMMAGAGYGLGQMGPAAQAAQLQSLQAMMSAGGMQQQLAQQYLNNLYANRMAQIGYPFQTAQYLAGITGGLAPAMGGTTQGQQQTWGAQPSGLAQGLGIGTSLLGMAGGLGSGLKGGGGGPTNMAFDTSGLGGGNTFQYTPYTGNRGGRVYARGGRTGFAPAHMKGGGTPPPLPPPPQPVWNPQAIGQSGALSAGIPTGGLSTEQALSEADPYFSWYGGVPDVVKQQIASMTTPAAQRPGGSQLAPMGALAGEPTGPMGAPGIIARHQDLFQSWMQKMRQQQPDLMAPDFQKIIASGGDLMASDPFGIQAAAGLGKQAGGAAGGDTGGSPFDSTDSVVPKIALQTGAGHSGLFPGQGITMQAPSGGGGGSGSGKGSTAGDIGKAAQIAMDVLPMIMAARGGGVTPMDAGLGFQEGGDTPDFGGYATSQEAEQAAASKAQWLSEMEKQSPVSTDVSAPGRSIMGSMPTPPAGFGYSGEGVVPGDFPVPPEPVRTPGGSAAAAPAANIAIPSVMMPRTRPMSASLEDPSANLPTVYRAAHSDLSDTWGPQAASAVLGNLGVESPSLNPRESHDQGTGIGIAGWRDDRRQALYDFAGRNGLDPLRRQTQLDFLKHEVSTNPAYADMMKRMQSASSPAEAARIFRTEFERPAGTTQGRPLGLNRSQELATRFAAGDFSNVGGGGGDFDRGRYAQGPMGSVETFGLRTAGPDLPERNWAQRATQSPWWNLVSAGARMAQTVGPPGVVLGAGIEQFGKSAEQQRKSLLSESDRELKAQSLIDKADVQLSRLQQGQERIQTSRESLDLRRQAMYGIPASTIAKIRSDVYKDPEIPAFKKEDEITARLGRQQQDIFSTQTAAGLRVPQQLPNTKEEMREGQYYHTNQGVQVWRNGSLWPIEQATQPVG